jgi:uncharacterized protein (TIGR03067 family)
MRLTALLLFAALTALAGGCGSSSPANPSAADKQRAQGTWVPVKVELVPAEAAPPEEELKKISATLKGDLLTITNAGAKEKQYALVTLDGSRSPGWVDFTESDETGSIKPKAPPGAKGPAGGGAGDIPPTRMLGIYKFEGDQLIVALGAPDGRRPTEFTAVAPRPGVVLSESGMVVVIHLKKQ